MRCRRCGAAIQPWSRLCSQCGATAGRRRTRFLRCRHCGRRVPVAGRLCPACGAELHRSWRRVLLTVAMLVLLGGSYYAVTQVITVHRIQQQLSRLSRVSLASLLPPPTPTFTPVPTETAEWRPTPTRIPTATSVPSPTPTASPTTTATSTAIPTARPPTAVPATATPAFPYPVVELLEPAAGADLTGDALVLRWKAVADLADEEWYGVSLRYWRDGQVQYAGAWIKETLWQVPSELHHRPDPARPTFEWDVRVMKRLAAADGSSKEVALSPLSEIRTFTWR